jgi:hypothetical protein
MGSRVEHALSVLACPVGGLSNVFGMAPPTVELLFWQGCPSHPRALADLRRVAADVGLDPDAVLLREVSTEAAARDERFVGSPTVRVDGVDVQDPGEEPAGLTCRVYRRRDGRISAVPDPDDLRDALRRALTRSTS